MAAPTEHVFGEQTKIVKKVLKTTNEKRLIVILEKSSLETVKVLYSKCNMTYELQSRLAMGYCSILLYRRVACLTSC